MIGVTTIQNEKSVTSNAAITAFTIAKFGADENTMGPAAGNTDQLIGIFQHDAASGSEVRIALPGDISWCKLGTGGITLGAFVTSDGTGQGVAPGSTAGTNYTVIGYALRAGSAGDLVPVMIVPSRIQG
jgi:hypothetical protein